MCNCFHGGRTGSCAALSASEVREAVRTAEAAACAAEAAAREAEEAACKAAKIVKSADNAICAAEAAAQKACQCAKAAEAAKDRIAYMLEQMNGSCGQSCHPSACGCAAEADNGPSDGCGCEYRY